MDGPIDNDTINKVVEDQGNVIHKTVLTRAVDMSPDVDDKVYTLNDMTELVAIGESETVLEVLVTQRQYIKLSTTKSNAAKKRELKKLQSLGWMAFKEFGREISKKQWKDELNLMYISNSY